MSYALSLDYDKQVPTLRRILATSQKTQWVVDDIAWQQHLNGGHYDKILEWQGALRSTYVQALAPKQKEELARQFVAYDFSQILHGEQCAMMLAAQLVNCVEDLDAKIYASTQVRDEARHVESVSRLVKRIGPIYDMGPVLRDTLNHLLNCQLWPKQVLGLQLFLEARALLSFRQHMLFVEDPVFREVVQNIERDESQHVAFGIQYIARGIEAMSPEQREEIIRYGLWLDENIWSLNKSNEYRAVFEECGLDFDEFEGSYLRPSFLRPSIVISSASAKSIEVMQNQFHRWFYSALQRVGLGEVIERRLGRKLGEQELKDASTMDTSALPWVNNANQMLAPREGAERTSVRRLSPRAPVVAEVPARRSEAQGPAKKSSTPVEKAVSTPRSAADPAQKTAPSRKAAPSQKAVSSRKTAPKRSSTAAKKTASKKKREPALA